jgi:hypothetical protein
LVLLLALMGAALLAVPGAALATTGHDFAGQFGERGQGDGQFNDGGGKGPRAVAVMPSTGEVFTLGEERGRVQRFSAAGVFQSSFLIDATYSPVGPVAVDPAGFGAVYVLGFGGAAPTAVLKYSASGTFLYQLDAVSSGISLNSIVSGNAALAVDPVDGTVYVAATDNGTGGQVIARFDGSTGAFIDSFDGSDGSDGVFQCPNGLAVDGSHRVYVLDSSCAVGGKNRVDRYSPTGVFEQTVDDGSRGALSAVAADPVSDEVYVAEAGPVGPQITHFSAGGGAPIYTFDASNVAFDMTTGVARVRALAVSGDGTVYTSDGADPVVEWFTQFDGPTVETVAVPSPSPEPREVVLEGTIDPEGVESSYHFEYGLDQTYGKRSPAVDTAAGSGSDPVAASTTVTGLEPNKTYHYRIVGSNSSGSIDGGDQMFTTAAAPATVDGVAPFASVITPRSASLHGTVNANNTSAFSTSYYLEYGTTTAYGQSAVGADSGTFCSLFAVPRACDGVQRPVVASVSGLEPGTLYHFRVVADNGHPDGPQAGADRTFITSPAAGGGATGVTVKRATLTGTINPHGEDTTYRFNYGRTPAYGSSTPEFDGGAGDGDQQVSHQVSGLSPDTIYHVQVVATSADGVTRHGGDGLFRTAPAPTAVAISPIGVSTGSATLIGDVDTYGLAGSYRFDVSSLDSSYQTSTVERSLAGNATAERVSAPVDGLPADETFVVRLVVTSNDSTEHSDQITFATASLPPRVFPGPPSDDSAYGCAAPRLDSYNAKPKPGDTITISGHDLGAGGTAMLGDRSSVPADWSATRFKLEIPEDAAGTLGLTVNCGQWSNTIAIAIFKRASNRFSIAGKTVRGSAVTLSVRVPGPGKLTTSAANTKAAKAVVKRAGQATVRIRLSRSGARALHSAKTNTLKVTARVQFTPAGGKPATKKLTITFKRKVGR